MRTFCRVFLTHSASLCACLKVNNSDISWTLPTLRIHRSMYYDKAGDKLF